MKARFAQAALLSFTLGACARYTTAYDVEREWMELVEITLQYEADKAHRETELEERLAEVRARFTLLKQQQSDAAEDPDVSTWSSRIDRRIQTTAGLLKALRMCAPEQWSSLAEHVDVALSDLESSLRDVQVRRS